VSERQLSTDIEMMKYDSVLGYNAPIIHCPKNKGYHYTDPNYSIEKLPLSVAEFQTLANALSLLKFKDAFKDFEAVIDKLMRVGTELTKNLDTDDIIEFQKAPYYAGEIHIDRLLAFIRAKQPITVEYKKFNSEHSSFYTLHPYYLKEYMDLWYLLCYYEEADEMRTFALDRIIGFEEKVTDFRKCTLPHPKDYFKDIIGITLAKGPVEDIILSFTPTMAPYIKAKPLHHSQETLIDTKEELQIRLRLIPNYELYATLLGFGKKVKVLAPLNVLEEIRKG
jgi:predicted DNA-binding transcriptional regulator YafY